MKLLQTDNCVHNLHTNQTLKFEKYIQPRVEITTGAIKVTGLDANAVKFDTPEKLAVQEICNFLSPKSIIVAHNAAFDRVTFLQAYQHCGGHRTIVLVLKILHS